MPIEKFVFNAQNCATSKPQSISDCFPLTTKDHITWINIDTPLDEAQLKPFIDHFHLHALVVQSMLHRAHRQKITVFENYIVLIAKMLQPRQDQHIFASEQVTFIVSQNLCITFQTGKSGDVFQEVRQLLMDDHSAVRHGDAAYLVYELIRLIAEHYFVILERIDDHIEELEINLINAPSPKILRRLHSLQREVTQVRKAIWPLREMLSQLERGITSIISLHTKVYFRDVYDHTIQLIDTIETQHDILASILDVYLATISNRLNSIIKVLTVIATIFLPLSLLAGIFGMNFRYLPGLGSPAGPLMVFGIMVIVASTLLLLFKWKKWL